MKACEPMARGGGKPDRRAETQVAQQEDRSQTLMHGALVVSSLAVAAYAINVCSSSKQSVKSPPNAVRKPRREAAAALETDVAEEEEDCSQGIVAEVKSLLSSATTKLQEGMSGFCKELIGHSKAYLNLSSQSVNTKRKSTRSTAPPVAAKRQCRQELRQPPSPPPSPSPTASRWALKACGRRWLRARRLPTP